MINISSIVESKLIEAPWEYKIIDNVFDAKDLDILTNAAKTLSSQYIDGDSIRAWMPVAKSMGVSQEAIDVIVAGGNQLLEKFFSITQDFYKGKLPKGSYFSMPKFEVTGTNYEYPIHKDSFDKLLTFVIYMYPEQHLGTRLYAGLDQNSYLGSIDWKVNRAFMISPEADKNGWHNWKNDLTVPRVTLNYTVRSTQELTNYFNNFHEESAVDCKLWLLDQFGRNNLCREIT
jgi:hypothetical protein